MTVKTVGQKATQALKNEHISGREAKQIIKAAETTPAGKADKVTKGEAKKIGEIFERATHHPRPGVGWNPPPPGHSPKPTMDLEARKAFNQFFIKHKLPYGENESAIKGQIQTLLQVMDRGEALTKAPSTKNLHEVFLHDHRPMNGERLDAFYDAEKNKFFLRSDSIGDVNSAGIKWFGPFPMAHIAINPPRPR
jgi:hypothetical protein